MNGNPEIITQRSIYQIDTVNNEKSRPVNKKHKKKRKWSDNIRSTLPIIDWLFLNYNWSGWLMEDTMSGITVAVLNIPQGMAYSILANVEPTVGLYMAVFPVLIYAILGTSKHISLGVLSVTCLMTGKIVSEYANDLADEPTGYSELQVATAVTMVVGIVQLLMYVFRLGFISTILSDTLVSSFTGSVSVIVLTLQFRELLGIEADRRQGLLHVPFTYYDFVDCFHTINWITTTASMITILTLVLYNKYLKEKINKKTFIPIPIELIVTIISTLIFQFTTIAQDHHMKLVGEIKSGLPTFEVPPVKLFQSVLFDSCVIALVAYSFSMSLALLMSEKMKYELDNNQELLAQGMSNVIGSFFACLPCAASPSRSASMQAIGGKTQMASIVSAGIIVVILLWIGPVFEPLPRCVLSSIVVVALKGIFIKSFDIIKIWKKSKSDSIIWIVTYLTVILYDIDIGLLAGVVVSLVVVLFKSLLIQMHVLGRISNTDLYVNLDTVSNAVEIPNIKIIQFIGNLNVLNRYSFKKKSTEITKFGSISDILPLNDVVIADNSNGKVNNNNDLRKCVVIDLSGLQYIDLAGAKMLLDLTNSLISDKIDVYIAAIPIKPYNFLRDFDLKNLKLIKFFPTVHDAVSFHLSNNNNFKSLSIILP
ncbi:pendrin-like isoform X2 [Daktulosphaira vitifoliae]|nr:pendrin-like isoform X2 [Daktulosphaira vitifoliae]XP_050536792.1 pendrin-like isoform X2 [Daktulosphaira vitifoliae]XP_050536798.1 pendrin-like isoform X2 [Daktulosphaira vitifoliae]XP_050536808.1 pendrin-like isoform X2 [Daktulosphaira vitifoliae]